jgi:hypothetical protein
MKQRSGNIFPPLFKESCDGSQQSKAAVPRWVAMDWELPWVAGWPKMVTG